MRRVPWSRERLPFHIFESIGRSSRCGSYSEWSLPVGRQLAIVGISVARKCFLQDQLAYRESPFSDLRVVSPGQLLLVGGQADSCRLSSFFSQVQLSRYVQIVQTLVIEFRPQGREADLKGNNCFHAIGDGERCSRGGTPWGSSVGP